MMREESGELLDVATIGLERLRREPALMAEMGEPVAPEVRRRAKPLDERLIAMFGMAGAIVLAATVFRQSADSDRWRGAFRHAEWYFFPAILVVSVGLLVAG